MEIKLLTKVTPRFEHCICTSFGISEEPHGVEMVLQEAQDNEWCYWRSTNKDMSCFIFKELEDDGYVIRNGDPITLGKMFKTVSVFVDNTDL